MKTFILIMLSATTILLSGQVDAQSCMGTPMSVIGDLPLPPAPDGTVQPPPSVNPTNPGSGSPPGTGGGGGGGGGGTIGGGGGGSGQCGSGGSPVYDTCRSYASCNADGRQTSGQADLAYYPAMVDGNGNISQEPYSGPFMNFSDVRGSNNPFAANHSGFPLVVNVTNGCYVSFAIVPGSTGAFQMGANPSFGTGGEISLSTEPGEFGQGNNGVICSFDRGGANSMNIFPDTSPQSGGCQVTPGQTYYINMRCGSWGYPSCNLSYTTYSGT